MAKSNLRTLSRILAGRYEQANDALVQFGEDVADTMLSPEEQEELSKKKQAVDVTLANLTITISAAAQGKLKELEENIKKEKAAYMEPLAQLLDNLADPDISSVDKKRSEGLVAIYNEKQRQLDEQLILVSKIAAISNIPAKKKRQRKLLRDFMEAHVVLETGHATTNAGTQSLSTLEAYFYEKLGIFTQVDAKLNCYQEYLSTISDVETSTAGDLDE